jgi:hypothetical protein
MPSSKATEHAKKFVDTVHGKGPLPRDGRDEFLKAAEEFLLPAMQQDGDARAVLADLVPVINDQSGAFPTSLDRTPDVEPRPYGFAGLDESRRAALSAAYLRAVHELKHPQRGPKIHEALRNIGQHRAAIRNELSRLEEDFSVALADEVNNNGKKEQKFKDDVQRGLADLESSQNRLRELALSGDGRENSPWEVGVVFACVLDAPVCAAIAIVVIVVVVVVVVVQATK